MQALRGGQTWYFLAPADAPMNLAELVGAAAHRHHIEQIFEFAKGECGLADYEVRSYVGLTLEQYPATRVRWHA